MNQDAELSAINSVSPVYDKGYKHIIFSWIFPNPESKYTPLFKNFINKKYNIEKIMKVMCDDVKNHNTEFDYKEIYSILNGKINGYSNVVNFNIPNYTTYKIRQI